jgi:hypothetical protein
MRAYLHCSAVVWSLALGAASQAAITVTKSNGQAVPAGSYTKTYDPSTGGWTITLLQLYAPFQETVYEIHANGGEIIDNLVSNVNGPAAGSPVVIRMFSDAPNGLRSVRNIAQTGSAETILNKVYVNEDIGSAQIEAIGDLIAGRDVLGPIIATTSDNSIRGVTSVQAGRNILGDVTADYGRVLLVWAQGGNIGASAAPVTIRAKYHVYQVMASADVYANINTRYNSGTGGLWALVANRFIGTVNAERLIYNQYNNVDGLIKITQQFNGTISLGKSYTSPSQYIELPVSGLSGQIIINADNVAGGAWSAPVRIGPQGNPNQVVLNGPNYPQTSASLGGGSVGLVPFKLHNQSCSPPNGATVTVPSNGPSTSVRLRHYGPVVWSAGAPVTIERRPAGSNNSYAAAPMGDFSIAPATNDPNAITIGPAPGRPGFASGFQYRIRPASALKCGVPTLPAVQWDSDYIFSVLPAVCQGDVNHSGAVNIDDLLLVITFWGITSPLFPAADINQDGQVNVTDLFLVINHWGACPQ